MKILLIFIVILCFSCHSRKQEINRILKEWDNKTILFPSTLQAKVYGKDTNAYELLEKKYKIVLHVDSTGCSPCKLGLYAWAKLIESYKLYQDSVSFILVVHVLNPRKMEIICRENQFKYPIFYDLDGKMDKANLFPKDESFRCFLIDSHNKVLAIGNPTQNEDVKKLYNNIILNK